VVKDAGPHGHRPAIVVRVCIALCQSSISYTDTREIEGERDRKRDRKREREGEAEQSERDGRVRARGSQHAGGARTCIILRCRCGGALLRFSCSFYLVMVR